jgi:6-phosphogluconolactonase
MPRAHLLLLLMCACGDGSAVAADAGSDGTPAIDAPVRTHLVAYVSGSGPDIVVHDVGATGALTPTSSTPAFRANPSFLAIDPAGTALYAVSEASSRVGAYAIDQTTGALTFINDQPSGGTGPAHVFVDRGGGYVLVANYSSGTIAVLPIRADHGIDPFQQMLSAGANAHMILTDPTNRFAFVPCLGADHVAQYTFDAGTGMLTPNLPRVMTAAGAGPRHLAFSPDGKRAYLINEVDSTLTALTLDGATGRLTPVQTITTLPVGFTGTNTTAEVWVHPSGKYVFGSNRGHNSIVTFSVDPTAGTLTLVGHTPTQGMTPRDFTLDPSGHFVFVANQASSNVVTFAFDATSGALSAVGAPIGVPSPSFVGIVALP